jgi:hypothetical protein
MYIKKAIGLRNIHSISQTFAFDFRSFLPTGLPVVIMHAFSHSLISLIALLGSTPLTSSLSVPKNEFVPRQASPEFKCEYQAGWEMCNEQGNRQCWVRSPEGLEFNNSTNYEDFVPEGE